MSTTQWLYINVQIKLHITDRWVCRAKQYCTIFAQMVFTTYAYTSWK